MAQDIRRGAGQIWGERAYDLVIRDVRFGVLRPLDIVIEPHVHEDRHLVFVFEGNYITSAKGAPPVSGTPILVDNPAGTAHRDRFLRPEGCFLTMNLAPEASSEGVARASRHPEDIARMLGVVAELEFDASTVLLEEVAEAIRSPAESAKPRDEGEPGWIRRAYEMVMDECPSIVTLDRLAVEADVHPVHLARTFRRKWGRTAGELIRERQFERACAMLAEGEMPIAEIALDLGFCDQAHFSRFFSRRAAMPPGRFRSRRPHV
ncbi:helix-turn-helix domain-containing protein [Alteriqipengyuania sp. 357]